LFLFFLPAEFSRIQPKRKIKFYRGKKAKQIKIIIENQGESRMNGKSVIKVFKQGATDNIINQTIEPKQKKINNEQKTRRELAKTISSWITECRERRHAEETESIRSFFGNPTPAM
jgi:hypothetical protein